MSAWLEMLTPSYNVKLGAAINYTTERSFNFGSSNFVLLILHSHELFPSTEICFASYFASGRKRNYEKLNMSAFLIKLISIKS